jgi:hypothetical protein
MNRPLHDHPFFADTDELEAFVSKAIDNSIDSKCDYCNRPQRNKKNYEGIYSVCEDCWSNNKNRAILDIQALYAEGDEPIPYTAINSFFKGYWEI